MLKEYADIHQIIIAEQEDDDYEAEPTVFSISASFFTDPESGDVIDKVKPAFQAWLKKLGLLDHQAQNLAERLPSYFVLVWRRITDAVRQLANQTPAGPLH